MLKPSLRVALLGVASCLAAPAVASAHPLGNFSVNHLAQVSVSADRVDVRYVLDEAEIPTFQQRDTAGCGDAGAQAGRGASAGSC